MNVFMQPRAETKRVWTMPRQRKGRMKSNEEKRLQRRQRLMDNKAYQTMEGLTRYMDRYEPTDKMTDIEADISIYIK